MSVFKCKMCGGALEIQNNETVATCEYCGTQQTLPKLDDDRRANLYDRANHFRRNNEFDKAIGIYEQILNEDNTDAEAYWSLVLCRYGIEYVEDPVLRKRMPTVNRAQFTSIFNDDNYKLALRYADGYQRSIYEEEANTINEIQKGILAISQKEEPFDVFICYKETDNNGRRTPDSVLANELYHQLTQEGFKVFFARITLEDKLGSAYEPYIFAALNSAKVMVVLGTKPEFFNAVWVKNEWSRYLALIKQGQKKMLIPAYKDMDPYDLPEEFSHLQAQDMSKLGFMQDLIRGIKKILQADTQKAETNQEVKNSVTDAAMLLKRAAIFLLDGEWRSANSYCEKVLDINPECAQAYLYKLMVDIRVHQESEFAGVDEPFLTNSNYKKIMLFGDTEQKNEVSEYANLSLYNSAIKMMSNRNYEEAKRIFDSLADFSDSKERSLDCVRLLEVMTQQARKDLEEKEKLRKEEMVNSYFRGLKVVSILSYVILFLLFLPFLMSDLKIENSFLGGTVFWLSVLALVPVGIIYIVFLIKTLVYKRKTKKKPEKYYHGYVQKILLLFFNVAALALNLLSVACVDFYMLPYYCIIAYLITLSHMLIFNFKSTLASKIMAVSLAIFITNVLAGDFYIFGISTRDLPILILIIISASISATLLVVMYIVHNILCKKRGNSFFHPFPLKYFIPSISVCVAIIAGTICFNNVSANKISERKEKMWEDLAGKTFVTAEYEYASISNYYGPYDTIAESFTADGKIRTVQGDGDVYTSDCKVEINWFGFGEIILDYRYILVYNEKNEIIGLIDKNDETEYILDENFSLPKTVK